MSTITQKSFKINIKVMSLLGLYPSNNSAFSKVRTYGLYFFLLVLGPILILIGVLTNKTDDKLKLSSNILYLSETIGFIFKIAPFLKNGEKIKKCVTYFDDPCFSPRDEEEKKIIEECVQICRRNSILYLCGIFCGVTVWIVPNIVQRRLPLDCWLPYNPECNVVIYWTTFFYTCGVVLYDGFSGTMLDPMIGGLAYHATCQLKIIKYNLQQLEKPCKNKHLGKQYSSDLGYVHENLRRCITLHINILKFVSEFEECFSFPAFCQFASSTVAICFCLIGMIASTNKKFETVIYLVYLLIVSFQVFFYCYYGTVLYEENNTLVTAIYMGPWYNYDIKIRKVLIIMMERAEVPMIITSGKVINLTLGTFAKVLKTSYSLIAVFNIYDKV